MRIAAPSAGSSGATEKQTAKDQFSSVCVVGLGYVGLPMAAVLADKGYHVCRVDIRSEVVDTVNLGNIHIHEPNLAHLIRRMVEQARLSVSATPQSADVFMICVPTPATPDHAPDLSYVEIAATSIQPYVRTGNLIFLDSTSPPSTTKDVIVNRTVRKTNIGEIPLCDPFVASNRFAECPLNTFEEILDRANMPVLLTNHAVFNAIEIQRLVEKVVIDPRGAWKRMHSQPPHHTGLCLESVNSAKNQCAA